MWAGPGRYKVYTKRQVRSVESKGSACLLLPLVSFITIFVHVNIEIEPTCCLLQCLIFYIAISCSYIGRNNLAKCLVNFTKNIWIIFKNKIIYLKLLFLLNNIGGSPGVSIFMIYIKDMMWEPLYYFANCNSFQLYKYYKYTLKLNWGSSVN